MTSKKDGAWEWHPKKPKNRKINQGHQKWVIHNNLVPLSNFIQLRQENLPKLQNVKTAWLKEPPQLILRISANEYSMLSENTPIGDGYGYYCLYCKNFTKNVRRLFGEREILLK